MREIKFRAWDKSNKRWLTMDDFGQHICYAAFGCDDKGLDTVRLGGTREDEDIEWLQYTGLLDKNGKEIYEGDVLCIPEYPTESNPMGESSLGVVRFMHGAFGWEMLDYKGQPTGQFDTFMGWNGYVDTLQEEEIIGNIYETPDLIPKQGKIIPNT